MAVTSQGAVNADPAEGEQHEKGRRPDLQAANPQSTSPTLMM